MQNGTPTSESPVDVVGVGERTENLFPLSIAQTITDNGVTIETTGDGIYHIFGMADKNTSITVQLLTLATIPISVGAGGNGTVSFFNSVSYLYGAVGFEFKLSGTRVDTWNLDVIDRKTNSYVVMGGKSYDSFSVWVNSGTVVDFLLSPHITDTGEFPNTFQPYGYKIPVSCGGVTTPIYLGQTQTLRRIKKLVLDGMETGWTEESSASNRFFQIPLSDTGITANGVCSHFVYKTISLSNSDTGFSITGPGTNLRIRPDDISSISFSDFKQWLFDQYAAGTPVTVWYVLSTPQIGIVNEPLMKIGDYVDTLDSTDADIMIPTVRGSNVLTVDTTVQPSSVTITGHIKPV